jgi:hypothetical protein
MDSAFSIYFRPFELFFGFLRSCFAMSIGKAIGLLRTMAQPEESNKNF